MASKSIIHYVILCVDEFARQKGLTAVEAFRYLYAHEGIDHLVNFYDIEHTLPLDDTIQGLSQFCAKRETKQGRP